MKNKIIKQGAEAILYKENNYVVKERIKKSYRINEMDIKLRKLRTRREGKLLQKSENSPNVFEVDDKKMKIKMEFLDGKLLKDILDNLNKNKRNLLLREIGGKVAMMHDKILIQYLRKINNQINHCQYSSYHQSQPGYQRRDLYPEFLQYFYHMGISVILWIAVFITP